MGFSNHVVGVNDVTLNYTYGACVRITTFVSEWLLLGSEHWGQRVWSLLSILSRAVLLHVFEERRLKCILKRYFEEEAFFP